MFSIEDSLTKNRAQQSQETAYQIKADIQFHADAGNFAKFEKSKIVEMRLNKEKQL